ncbi:pirin family protein [Reinekea blandensis]|uniref:Pirin family protein n=1 Tax=Reinekea blandensis MED297 TaxID=314283 RepID=A4BKH7_9GAMM|nr:pirin family protein [Reinekea blandensis]EAR07376.1 hypothetical protein MED297_05469 [Reinekea sp. MED297] [Reinekea blandensis MED297]
MTAILETFQLGFPWKTFDPFLFCVFHNDRFPKGNGAYGPDASLAGRNIGQDFAWKDGWNMYHGDKIPGFPGHPHRGFETITVVNEGLVDHADSLGAAGRYGGGDTQWMTAGKGVQHSEMFPLLSTDENNPLELFQIWINLPAKNKMVTPHFAMLWREDTPVVEVPDSNDHVTTVKVIAGALKGHQAPPPPPESWAADAENDVAVWHIKVPAGGEFHLPAASGGLNRALYLFSGSSVSIEESELSINHGVRLQSDAVVRLQAGNEPVELLLLQGKPIAEPVVQYGPFVMNSEAEIHQAFADYRRDQFGGWPWGSGDPVHSEAKGRFARHIDGRLEEKPL